MAVAVAALEHKGAGSVGVFMAANFAEAVNYGVGFAQLLLQLFALFKQLFHYLFS
jgi:hypothetical protein